LKKVLVTGGAGYIGSILVPVLLDSGYEVTVLDSFKYGQNSLVANCSNTRFKIIKGDVRDRDLLSKEVKSADILIPLAAIVGAPACARSPVETRDINAESIKHLASIASINQKIIFPVTNSGYGIGESGKMCTEDSPLKPISLYGKTKVDAESYLIERGNVVALRLATVFGAAPRMRIDLLVNDFVYRAVYDRFIVLFEAHFKRNYIHIRDVVNAIIFSIHNYEKMRSQSYNCGLSTANLSKLELCELIKKHLPSFYVTESTIGEDPDKRDYIVSNEKLESLGWSPNFTLDDGVEELIKAYTMIRNGGQFDNL
jgi:nucleoside-diphosphate-sugar epimerase